jgi:O-methyltransferase involved in polyketide biosynthesis
MCAEKVALSGVTETLLMTLHARACDSRSANPILGDSMAADVARRIDYDFGKSRANDTVAIAVRAKQLDAWTAEFLTEHATATVLHLGCGLDSRVFRVNPPGTVKWYDLDYPNVIGLRRRLLPARDGCHLIARSVTDPGAVEDVPADRPVIIIAEGLLCYLNGDDVHHLLVRLTSHFFHGEIVFDAYTNFGMRLMRFHPFFASDRRDASMGTRRSPRTRVPRARPAVYQLLVPIYVT